MGQVQGSEQAHLERVAADGFDATTFKGSRVVRALAGGATRASEHFILLHEDDVPAEEVIRGLRGPTRVVLEEQRFCIQSDIGPILIYSGSTTGPHNELLDELRTTSLVFPPLTDGVSPGPFSPAAQEDVVRFATDGFGTRLVRGSDEVQVVGVMLSEIPGKGAEEFVERVCTVLKCTHTAVEIFETGWARPYSRLLVFKSRPRPVRRGED